MIRIWHHGAWNRNLGDWVLHESTQHHIARATHREVLFTSIDSQKTRYDRRKIEELNDTADLLLVGGGGLVFHRPEDRSVSGWQWNIAREDLALIRVPIVVYGIGYNRFPFDRNSDSRRLAQHLREVQDRAALFSVRNTGTRSALSSLGLSPGRMRLVSDAAIFAPWNVWNERDQVEGDGPLIAWNFSGDRPRHRYPEPHLDREAACVEAIAEALHILCGSHGARILMIPHLQTIDERYDEHIAHVVGREHLFRLPELTPEIYPPRAESTRRFVGAYASCDLAIGMRGHSCMIPFGREKRFVALSTHAKTEFFLEDVGLQNLAISPQDLWTGRLSSSDLAARLLHILDDRSVGAAITHARRALQSDFERLNRDVLRIAQRGGSQQLERRDAPHHRHR